MTEKFGCDLDDGRRARGRRSSWQANSCNGRVRGTGRGDCAGARRTRGHRDRRGQRPGKGKAGDCRRAARGRCRRRQHRADCARSREPRERSGLRRQAARGRQTHRRHHRERGRDGDSLWQDSGRIRDAVRHESSGAFRAGEPPGVADSVWRSSRHARVVGAPFRGRGSRRPGFERTPYDPFVAYGRAKTANILFAVAFDQRHRARGVRAAAVHPGGIHTELARHMDESQMTALLERINSQLAVRRERAVSVQDCPTRGGDFGLGRGGGVGRTTSGAGTARTAT